ncbi:hypothetical protein BCAH1134_C0043 (plasmid) [Bacillus cereus AH1134]|nr:hypothetical protein BCAH1134_C0043 [Bacillus cereus AH1134]
MFQFVYLKNKKTGPCRVDRIFKAQLSHLSLYLYGLRWLSFS